MMEADGRAYCLKIELQSGFSVDEHGKCIEGTTGLKKTQMNYATEDTTFPPEGCNRLSKAQSPDCKIEKLINFSFGVSL